MSLIGVYPILIFFNSEELREEAKTRDLLIPPSVLCGKVWRKYGAQRLNSLLVVLFIAFTWLPYFLLDFYLIKYRGQSVEAVLHTNTYIGIAIGVSMAVGVPHVIKFYIKVCQQSHNNFITPVKCRIYWNNKS